MHNLNLDHFSGSDFDGVILPNTDQMQRKLRRKQNVIVKYTQVKNRDKTNKIDRKKYGKRKHNIYHDRQHVYHYVTSIHTESMMQL